MKKDFKNYLINAGFSLYTPSYQPSTIYDYLRGLKRVCIEEKMTIDAVAANIDTLVMKYQPAGASANVGRSIHRSCRCGLVAFAKFVKSQEVA